MRFRKKPVEVEAFRWTADEHQTEDPVWICEALRDGKATFLLEGTDQICMYIETLEGVMMATPGDWIVKGTRGELYPVKPDIFDEIYEPAEETSNA